MIGRKDLKVVLPVAISAFFLLAGYSFFRPAINSLYKEAYGADTLPLVMGFGVLGVMLAVWFYSRLLSWVGPRQTLLFTSIGSGLLIAIHYLGFSYGLKWVSFSGYILKEAYIVLIIEQYWSFLNSMLVSKNAKKLFGVVLGVSALGSIVGSQISAHIVIQYGSEAMLLAAAVATLFAGIFSDFSFQLAGEPDYNPEKEKVLKDKLGLQLFRLNPILKYIFFVILLTQVFSSLTELQFQSILEISLINTELQNRYENQFWSVVEIAGLFFNFILSPLLLSFISLRWIHFIFPAIHIISVACVILYPSLATITISFFLFKSLDYSIFRAAKELLYIPFSFDARYRAKEVIDVFGYRAGKGGISFAIAGFKQIFGSIGVSIYGGLALVSAVVWLCLVPGLTQNVKPSVEQKNK